MRYALAIDIGASSGRHIVGWKQNGVINTDEVYRFSNGVSEHEGHLTWDICALVGHVKTGIDEALRLYPEISTLSVDTWGVDYILLDGDRELLPAYAYRDRRTASVIDKVHEIIPFSELYERTGCQFQPFNTVYQLYADLMDGRLQKASDLLMMPEYLMWKLCKGKAREFTNATTTGLINAKTLEYDGYIIEKLGLMPHLFGKINKAGEVIGEYKGIKVVLCATHDTGSAVEAIPMSDSDMYLSSGTWSLLGVKTERPVTDAASETANYSNEGGVGYNRYQKNIMGMWLINELRRELCPHKDFAEIACEANSSTFDQTVDVDQPEFLAPQSMKAAFDCALGREAAEADYFRCAYMSLAQSYAKAIRELEANTGKSYNKLYIVGGGAKNGFLNKLTQEATSKEVIALPMEASAEGNIKIQLEVRL